MISDTFSQRAFNITLYAPAGAVREPQALVRAETFLRNASHRVHTDADATQHYQRFAGDDETRLAAVHRVLYDTRTEIALAIRGGYGWTRLLDRLDYNALARDPKYWIGHSDFTAFQLAALAKSRHITFAGPMACSDFGAEEVSAFTVRHCFDLLTGFLINGCYEVSCTLHGDRPLEVEGMLWGGNLSMVTHLIGTPYFPAIDGGILFLEDVHEAPYRVERMLYQLHHSGVLARQHAVLLGHFTLPAEMDAARPEDGYTLASAVAQLQRVSGVPFYSGLPFGHVRDKLTLPVGADCALTVDGHGQARLVFQTTL